MGLRIISDILKHMKIMVTGTHFTPAQAVIEELKKFPEVEIVYIGRKYTQEGDEALSVESKILPTFGVKFIPIIAGRLRRHFDFWTIISFLKIPIGFIQSFFILLKEKPDVSLSFGGYVSVPVVFNSWILSIPVMIHEQTLVSGIASLITQVFADKVALSFEKKSLKDRKMILTGNPIRQSLFSSLRKPSAELNCFLKNALSEKLPLIYITGGNQGSDIINQNISSILDKLTEIAFVCHQTGDSKENYFDNLKIRGAKLKNCKRYLVKKWFDVEDVSLIYKKFDLVISRAGINTLTELSHFQIKALVIPLPFIFNNEQVKNAEYFKSLGLCEIIYQDNLNSQVLLKKIKLMIKSNLKKQGGSVREKMDPKNSAKIIAQEILLMSNENDRY